MKMNKKPLKANQPIIYDGGLQGALTVGKTYTVLEDEVTEKGWRIIRVMCDDGIARKVPPQMFHNEAGEQLGCNKCFDRGIIHGGEEMGEYIKQCECQRR